MKKKIIKVVDEMTSRISLKIKQMFDVFYFNNEYMMLKKLHELLQFVENAQFMRFMKKIYSLKTINFDNMSEFFIHVKIFMKKIIAIEMNFTTNKQILICMMMTLNFRYENLIQIWNLLSNLTSKRIKNIILKKKRRQKNREMITNMRTISNKNKKKCFHYERKSHSENECWKLYFELIFDWFKKNKKK